MNAIHFRRRKNAWAALGALIAVGAVAFFAWRWTSGLDGGVATTELAMDAETPTPEFVPKAAPVLVDVLDLPASSGRTKPAAEAQRPVASSVATAEAQPKKERRKKSAREPKAKGNRIEAKPLKLECRVTPSIDTHLVPDLNYGVPVTLSFAPLAGSLGFAASATGLIDHRPTLSCAIGPSTEGIPRLVVDHPDALRSTVTIYDWNHQGAKLSARPTVTLRPIGLRLQMSTGRVRSSRSHAFDGTATLVALDSNGDLEILDSTSVGPKLRRVKPLRYGKTTGKIYIIGTPTSSIASADILDITSEVTGRAMDGSRHDLTASFRGRTPSPIKFDVIDPFGSPLKGATVTATIDPSYVARFTQGGSPVQFGGFVLVKKAGKELGQLVRNGEAYALDLGLARAMAEDDTSANGQAILHGMNPGVCSFTVKSPFGDRAPVEFRVQDTEAFQVTCAPLAAVEVHCPTIWRLDDAGRDAWARAKVKLSGKSKLLPFTKDDAKARSPRRFLVPANRRINISCSAKGTPKMSGKIKGPGPRQITTFFPRPAE